MSQRLSRWGLQYVALLVGIPALSGLLLLLPGERGPAGPPVAVRVGYSPELAHMQALVGLGDGTFARRLGEGAAVSGQSFATGTAAMEALLAGELDLAYVGPLSAISGYQRSAGRVRVVSGSARGGHLLVARGDTDIRTPADVRGHRVMIGPTDAEASVLVRQLLGQRARLVVRAWAETLPAFTRREVEAACLPEPWATGLVEEAGGRVIADEQEMGASGYPAAVVVARTAFLQRHPRLVRRWLQAHGELTARLRRREPTDMMAVNAGLRQATGKPLSGKVLFPAAGRVELTTDAMPDRLAAMGQAAWQQGLLPAQPDLTELMAWPAP